MILFHSSLSIPPKTSDNLHLCTFCKRQKTKDFVIFSGGIEVLAFQFFRVVTRRD